MPRGGKRKMKKATFSFIISEQILWEAYNKGKNDMSEREFSEWIGKLFNFDKRTKKEKRQ